MFNFNRTNKKSALDFLQKKDIDVAQAYRTRNYPPLSQLFILLH